MKERCPTQETEGPGSLGAFYFLNRGQGHTEQSAHLPRHLTVLGSVKCILVFWGVGGNSWCPSAILANVKDR